MSSLLVGFLVAESRGYSCCSAQVPRCGGFHYGVQALDAKGSVAAACRLQGAQTSVVVAQGSLAWLVGLIAPSIQNFPKPGIEPASWVVLLGGRFLSTLTPGKAQSTLDLKKFLSPFPLINGFYMSDTA